jgi:hypothetical protein
MVLKEARQVILEIEPSRGTHGTGRTAPCTSRSYSRLS